MIRTIRRLFPSTHAQEHTHLSYALSRARSNGLKADPVQLMQDLCEATWRASAAGSQRAKYRQGDAAVSITAPNHQHISHVSLSASGYGMLGGASYYDPADYQRALVDSLNRARRKVANKWGVELPPKLSAYCEAVQRSGEIKPYSPS